MKFEEILVAITLFTGVIWLIDIFFLKRVRMNNSRGNTKEPIVIEYARSFFPVLIIVLILRSFVAEPFKIPSGSMKPGLIEGDFILVNKFTYGLRVPILGYKLISINKPKRGEVMVFRHPDHKDLIKRVVGLPGDRINYRDKCIFINGIPVYLTGKDMVKEVNSSGVVFKQIEKLGDIEHSIFTEPAQPPHRYKYDNFVVPEDSYFVMGDNRDNSQDSRYWGAVSDRAIIGRAFAVWWSWDIMDWSDLLQFWKFHVRWDRVGTAIK